MLEFFSGIAAAWREVLHVSEWTGLSVGALAALAVLVYFDPAARRFAIHVAVVVVSGYWFAIYAYHLGAGDVRAQWAAANGSAAAASDKRDTSIEKRLESEFPPVPATQADPDEAKILADLSAAAAGSSCQLGAGALRLRKHH